MRKAHQNSVPLTNPFMASQLQTQPEAIVTLNLPLPRTLWTLPFTLPPLWMDGPLGQVLNTLEVSEHVWESNPGTHEFFFSCMEKNFHGWKKISMYGKKISIHGKKFPCMEISDGGLH